MFSPSGISSEIATVTKTLKSIAPTIETLLGVPAGSQTAVSTAITDLSTASEALAKADTAAAAQPLMERIWNDLQSVLQVAEGLPLPAEVAIPIRIITMLMPVLAAAAALVWPPSSNVTASTPNLNTGSVTAAAH